MAGPRGAVLLSGHGRRCTIARKEIGMKDLKEERQDDGAIPGQDTVTAQGENQAPKARQPNERDESVDSQAAESASIGEMGQIAHDAAASGQQDTSKALETDATYERLRRQSAPAPLDKPNRNQKTRG
jgi:hypothetical protein